MVLADWFLIEVLVPLALVFGPALALFAFSAASEAWLPTASSRPAPLTLARVGRCPFCQADVGVEEPQVVCADCLARHHRECWERAGTCAACQSLPPPLAPADPPRQTPSPAAEPAPAGARPSDPSDLAVRVPGGGRRCPFCQADVTAEEAQVACAGCLARHHRECWDEHARCASCGTDERFAQRERTGDRRLTQR